MTENDDGAPEENFNGSVLPEEGVADLSDQLLAYLTEIDLTGLPDMIGQVLDDFLEQCGGMPEDLADPSAFDQITRNQTAVTLAYQLGRLEGRSPQVVRVLIEQAIEKRGARPIGESPVMSDEDLKSPKELVYPRLRRLEYQESGEESDPC